MYSSTESLTSVMYSVYMYMYTVYMYTLYMYTLYMYSVYMYTLYTCSCIHCTCTVLATEIRPPCRRAAPARGSDFSCQDCTLDIVCSAEYGVMLAVSQSKGNWETLNQADGVVHV